MILFWFVLTACGPASTSATEPIGVLQGYLNGLNAENLDQAMSFVADQAVFISGVNRYAGSAEIRATLQSAINDGVTIHARDFSEDNGRVLYKAHIFVRDGEVDMVKALTIIRDGKIVFDGTESTWAAECDRDGSQAFCAAP
jgi:hypothetical protein